MVVRQVPVLHLSNGQTPSLSAYSRHLLKSAVLACHLDVIHLEAPGTGGDVATEKRRSAVNIWALRAASDYMSRAQLEIPSIDRRLKLRLINDCLTSEALVFALASEAVRK